MIQDTFVMHTGEMRGSTVFCQRFTGNSRRPQDCIWEGYINPGGSLSRAGVHPDKCHDQIRWFAKGLADGGLTVVMTRNLPVQTGSDMELKMSDPGLQYWLFGLVYARWQWLGLVRVLRSLKPHRRSVLWEHTALFYVLNLRAHGIESLRKQLQLELWGFDAVGQGFLCWS